VFHLTHFPTENQRALRSKFAMVSERHYRAEGGTAGEAMRGIAGGFRRHFADIGAFRAANRNYWRAAGAPPNVGSTPLPNMLWEQDAKPEMKA
jgi:hypothetical protein